MNTNDVALISGKRNGNKVREIYFGFLTLK